MIPNAIRAVVTQWRFYKIHNREVPHIFAVLKTFPFRNHPCDSRRVGEIPVLHLIMRFFCFACEIRLDFQGFLCDSHRFLRDLLRIRLVFSEVAVDSETHATTT